MNNLGPCCVCERDVEDVVNLMLLPRRAPIAGHGWGCVVCNLPHDGAIAVLCTACVGLELRFVCRGYPTTEGRMPLAELGPEEFEHKMDIDHGCTSLFSS